MSPPPEPLGGLRDRMVFESFARMLKDALTELGWFDPDRAHDPIIWRTSIVPESEELPRNTLAISTEDSSSEGIEIGSGLSEDRSVVVVDFYAQNDALGRHLAGDVRDVLRGKMPPVREDSEFVVYDWREEPPVPLFWADIEAVALDRAHGFDAPFRRHWFSVMAEIVEERP
jgi:hypothetical protein